MKESKANKISSTRFKLKTAFSGIKRTADDKMMSFSYSPNCYGFTFRGGVLKSDLGLRYADACYSIESEMVHNFQPFPAGVKILEAFVYQKTNNDGSYGDMLVVHTNENLLYSTKMFTNDTWHLVLGVSFTGKGSSVNYNYNSNDCLLLSSPINNLLIINGEQVTSVPSAPHFTSMCVHYERIFASDSVQKKSVWFSADFDPTNWTTNLEAGGFINFSDECGEVLKVVSFLDYVYVFREHGIFRLVAYAEQTEFSVSKVFVDTGKIYGDTIAQFGDKIVFLADDGLYIFDGYNVSRIAKDLHEIEYKSRAVATFFEGKYYLACRFCKFVDIENTSWKNNALVEYDMSLGIFSIVKNVDIVRLISVNVHHNAGVLAVFGSGITNFMGSLNNHGKVMLTNTEKHWESPVNDLGNERKKVVREIQLTTSASLILGVIVDGKVFEYALEGSTLPQKILVGKSGYTIGFYIDSVEEDIELTPPIALIDLL
ncbi:MAG TPA: hypothetical protein VJZ69_02090 [Clostridia bacterium]|nr:hypothetical protein [Clostridia bacterium]